MASGDDPEFSLKMTMDPKSKRVLFAEAGKDVVDFIFSLLYMPMASIVKLLANEHMAWSIGCIYQCVESMAETHLECSEAKSLILSPALVSPSSFLTGSSSTMTTYGKYYKCTCGSGSYFTDVLHTRCPYNSCSMSTELKYVGPNSGRIAAEAAINARGFVKGVLAYIVMDDLTVMPVSSVACIIALLNKFDIKDVSLLEERMVKFGKKEVHKSYAFCPG